MTFPQQRDALRDAIGDDHREVRRIVAQLPAQEYRDAAEVARAFGELRTHEPLPTDQPSKTGGKRAMQAPSAARFASLFEGMRFPASCGELEAPARGQANEEEMQTLALFAERTYYSMADVAEELGRVR